MPKEPVKKSTFWEERAARLAADTDVSTSSGFFDVGGSSATVTLTTRNPIAADGTRNISIDNGTCTGLTTAPTSAGTLTAGGTAIALLADKPYVWAYGDYNSLHDCLANKVFTWDVANSSGSAALINQHGLVDPTP